MPRGIPNAKPATKTTGAKPGPKPGAKTAAAAKPAVAKPVIQPLPAATTTNQLATVGLIDTPTKGTATMSPVSPAVAEAIAKLEAATKATANRPSPFRHGHNQRDNWFSLIGSKKGLRQTATLYLNGEALASTQDFSVASEYVVIFLVDDKNHVFSYQVESETYIDLSNYSGVLLSPVDRTEVEKIIANSDKAALALAEDDLVVLLQQERPAFKRGDRVYHMIDKAKQYLVVEAPKELDPYRPQPFSRNPNEVDLDMVIIEVGVTYVADKEVSVAILNTEPKKVYSGLYLLAD